MNRIPRLLTIAAACACSLSMLAERAHAQGQPQPQNGGGSDSGRQPSARGRGTNSGANAQPPAQRGGGQGGGGFGGGMFGGGGRAMFEPSVSAEDMDRYGKMLNFSKSQGEAVKALLDAYSQEFNTAAQKARDQMDALREEARDDPSVRTEIGELFAKFRTKRTEMETGFFNDVKATLTPEQQTTWPVVERTRRRESTMNRGLMSFERADLVKIIDDLKLASEARKPVSPILDQYQVDLDRALIVRNDAQDKLQGNMRDLFNPGGDQTKAQKMFEDGRAASTKVREVNKRYARQVEAALPDDATRTKFNEVVRRESFPLIYRPSYANRVVDAAGAIDGLSPEQKTTIAEIKDRFNRELTGLNQKMETAYEQREQTITIADLMSRFGGGGGAGGGGQRGGGGFGMIDSEELSTMRDQRRELETTTVEKIQALLNEEQKAKLPQRGAGGGGRGMGGDNGGGGGGGQRRARPGNTQPTTPPNGRT
jgi:Spy/CpxP family protein refolding chaperone